MNFASLVIRVYQHMFKWSWILLVKHTNTCNLIIYNNKKDHIWIIYLSVQPKLSTLLNFLQGILSSRQEDWKPKQMIECYISKLLPVLCVGLTINNWFTKITSKEIISTLIRSQNACICKLLHLDHLDLFEAPNSPIRLCWVSLGSSFVIHHKNLTSRTARSVFIWITFSIPKIKWLVCYFANWLNSDMI